MTTSRNETKAREFLMLALHKASRPSAPCESILADFWQCADPTERYRASVVFFGAGRPVATVAEWVHFAMRELARERLRRSADFTAQVRMVFRGRVTSGGRLAWAQ